MENVHFSGWLYKLGAGILFVLAVIAIIAFIKALSVNSGKEERKSAPCADSTQVAELKKEVQSLNKKVDSLLILSQKEPRIVYKHLKPQKDCCIIDMNIHYK